MTDAVTDDSKAGTIRSVERAIAILKTFTGDSPEQTASEICRKASLNKSTIHRFLKTLEAGGFVVQVEGSRRYRLGLGLVELGNLALEHFEIREIARPFLREAAHRSGASVHLAQLADREVIYIDKLDNSHSGVRINTTIGTRRPLHCTGLGKVLLAAMDQSTFEHIASTLDLRRYTPTTIGSLAELAEQCAQVRECGYAIDDGEFNELVKCVAAPIHDRNNHVVAAISLALPGVQVDSPRFREMIQVALDTVQTISAALGYRPKVMSQKNAGQKNRRNE